ncbi:MAG: SPOR domain-containing protein [Bacteroidetes bacterium]|nr:SPOR domain-containing protein [Bacteroidota bacterium]
MELRVKVEQMVLELLGENSCVTLPGLGSFIYRETQAASNTFTYEIRPAVRTVFFNSAITADDGLMANALREQEGLSFSGAQDFLKQFVEEIKASLKSQRNLAFGKLGNFFLNSEDQVFFFPSPTLNLSHETFGLPVLKLDELEKTKTAEPVAATKISAEKAPEFAVTPEEEYEEAEVVQIKETEHKGRKNRLWKVAAAIAILMLAGTGVYFGMRFIQSPVSASMKSSIDTPQSAPVETVPAEIPITPDTTAPAQNEEMVQDTWSSNTLETTKSEQSPQISSTGIPMPEAKTEAIAESSVKNLNLNLQELKGNYFVIAGKYLNPKLADMELQNWNNNQIAAVVYKSENSSLYKVILGRFKSIDEANTYAASLPALQGVKFNVGQIKNFK